MTASSPQNDLSRFGACSLPDFSRVALDELYAHLNRREFVHPDPLEFLYAFENPLDRELVGLIASSLAYGRVTQILRSVSVVLALMGPSPSHFVLENSEASLRQTFRDFKHRFTTGEELSGLLIGARKAIMCYGSLERCFASGLGQNDSCVLPALTRFVEVLTDAAERSSSMFVPSPHGGSACKRLNLFLRWMVRCDDVDPGVWTSVSPSSLIVPLDTHMFRMGLAMGLTRRKQADMKAAMEITSGFRSIARGDPVRYDFALTRIGIWKELYHKKS